MFTFKLPSTQGYFDLTELANLPKNQSFIVTNNSGTQLRIVQSETEPTGKLEGFPIWPNDTALVHGNDSFPVWAKGGTDGYVTIQPLTSTVIPLTAVELPQDIVTSGIEGFRRLQVDQGQTGFFEGRNFRFLRKVRSSVTYKFVSDVDFILYEQNLSCSQGAYEFHAWREDTITEDTAFTTDLTQYIAKQNISNEYRDYSGGRYQSQVQIFSGGSITISDLEAYVDYVESRSANATAQRATVGQVSNTQRYLAAGTYYLQIDVLDDPVRGIYQIGWEERPPGTK